MYACLVYSSGASGPELGLMTMIFARACLAWVHSGPG